MIWRTIPSLPAYLVSDQGDVKSAATGRVLAKFIDASGYYRMGLRSPSGGRVNKRVHALVAEAFIGPRPEGAVTRHLDGDPLNNAPGNLTYGTQSQNVRDSIAHGTQRNARKTHCKRGHEFSEANTRIEGRQRKCRACRALLERQRRVARKEST